MDPVSAIGLASSILTFVDLGYKVVTGTLEIAQTGQAPHTEPIDAVAHNLEVAVAKFSQPVSPNASDPEKALGEVAARCQTLLTELLTLLNRFKVPDDQSGISWEKFKIVITRMRKDSKIQELQRNLAEYRSQILVNLVIILNDRQLATQVQISNALGEARTDLRSIRHALDDVRTEILDKFEQVQMDERSKVQPISNTPDPLLGQKALLDKIATQFRQAKDALDHLAAGHPEKTPETRILEHVYFGNSMFQREETLKPAHKATFRWFVQGVSNEDDGDSAPITSGRRDQEETTEDVDDNTSIDSERTDREETSRVSSVEALKAEVSSRFEEWLRSGHGVFHISGKAGSGKSTLMKLVLSTERTHELLRAWAGDKRLLFARFYFWAGGDQIQNSLEGLQRSILFEILIQRPDLVEKVFREAYSTFANKSWDSPIHSQYFSTARFQEAFERLMLLPADPKYRLCLFIDGLDEYGADVTSGSLPGIQRENLAQSLASWASNDNVKILASSRPYSEFSDVFAEDQRVHLHQLTHADMTGFGHHLFERHRVFELPGVKEGYRDLVEKVVHASDGVFLWTGLTIQRMLLSLAKRDSFQSLEQQLEATPRGLSKLYDRMFSEIDEDDHHEAMKIMLLVAEERKYLGNMSHPRGVNAMALSWLEPLKDAEFPANQPFLVYTEDEIEDKRKFAEARVNGYTGGLLEVTTYTAELGDDEPLPLHMRHTLQFFHKTAMEYVASSRLARDVLSSSPNLFNLEFYTRLSLAELHVGSSHGGGPVWGNVARYQEILTKYFNIPNPCLPLIEAYRAAFEQQARYSAWVAVRICFNSTWQPFSVERQRKQSSAFDNWVANEVQGTYAAGYVTERSQNLHEPRSRDGLSLLLSAACGHEPTENPTSDRLDRVKTIVKSGANLRQCVRLRLRPMGDRWPLAELTVWQVWCLYYATFDENRMLELFLETDVESDCYILMREQVFDFKKATHDPSDDETSEDGESGGDSKPDELAEEVILEPDTDLWASADKWMRPYDSSPKKHRHRCRSEIAYVISLKDFIRQAKPVNYEQLQRLLSKKGHSQGFSTTELSEIEAELATSKHPEFKNPRVRSIDVNRFFKYHSELELMVYWIRWKDATIPGHLELRLY